MRYPVPACRHRVEQVIDRSRFICTVERVRASAEAQAFIREMNVEFPDASHNCWAYIAGIPGSTDRIGLSDDGEPHGTAGRPMFTVLSHSGIGEIAAVVTRFFGGIKLGTGGLVRAYSGAVQQALTSLPTIERVDTVIVTFSVGYNFVGALQQILSTTDAEILEQHFGVDVALRVSIPRERVGALTDAVQNLVRGGAVFDITES